MSGAATPRLALKVDCDTFEGTRDGIPRLLRLLERHAVRASFFFVLGPDRSGRAALRVFTRKGFLAKMLRSNAAATYPLRTMLYGTLLPAPDVGARLGDVMRSVAAAGHEVGIHGWDHVRWHDRLDRMSPEAVARDYGRAHARFAEIFGRPARASAAPGWHVTAAALELQERHGLLYASNTRGGGPFFPVADGRRFDVLEIPSTLPTWDETLGGPEHGSDGAFVDHYRRLVRATEVHSIHTEVEATSRHDLFARQLEAWKSDGVAFVTLEELAAEALADRTRVPVRRLVRIELPGRAGLVSSSVA